MSETKNIGTRRSKAIFVVSTAIILTLGISSLMLYMRTDSLQIEVGSLQENNESLYTTNLHLETKVSNLTDERVELQKIINDLEKNNTNLESLMNSLAEENDNLLGELDSLTKKRADLQSQVDALTKNSTDLQSEVDDLTEEIDDLEWKVWNLELEIWDLEYEMELLEQIAEENKFEFYYASLVQQRFGIDDLEEYLDRWEWIIGTYKEDIFDCSEMSAYIEWRLENEGYHTYIAVGETPWEDDTYHAWLLVETSEDAYMPVEATVYDLVSWSDPYFDNYYDYDQLFETIHDALYDYPDEFDWWND